MLTSAQIGSNGADSSMTDMLDGFDGLPMTLDVNNLDDKNNDVRLYKQTSPAMQQQANGQTEEASTNERNISGDATSGAGAGPLPTGFGVQSTLSGGSTLTEFTKRRNWPQRVIEELKDFLHILT